MKKKEGNIVDELEINEIYFTESLVVQFTILQNVSNGICKTYTKKKI